MARLAFQIANPHQVIGECLAVCQDDHTFSEQERRLFGIIDTNEGVEEATAKWMEPGAPVAVIEAERTTGEAFRVALQAATIQFGDLRALRDGDALFRAAVLADPAFAAAKAAHDVAGRALYGGGHSNRARRIDVPRLPAKFRGDVQAHWTAWHAQIPAQIAAEKAAVIGAVEARLGRTATAAERAIDPRVLLEDLALRDEPLVPLGVPAERKKLVDDLVKTGRPHEVRIALLTAKDGAERAAKLTAWSGLLEPRPHATTAKALDGLAVLVGIR